MNELVTSSVVFMEIIIQNVFKQL